MQAMSSPDLPESLRPWIASWNGLLTQAMQTMIESLLAQLHEESGDRSGDEALLDLMWAQQARLQADFSARLEQDLCPQPPAKSVDLDADAMQLLDQHAMEEEVVARSLVSRLRMDLAQPLQKWREVLLQQWQLRQWPGSRPLAYDPDRVMMHGLELLRSLSMNQDLRRRMLAVWARSVVAQLRSLLPKIIEDLQRSGLLASSDTVVVSSHESARPALQWPQELDALRQSLWPLLRSQLDAWLEELHRAFQARLSVADAAEQDRLLALVQAIKAQADTLQAKFFETLSAQMTQMQQSRSLSSGLDLGLLDEQDMEWNVQVQTIAVRLRQREASGLQALLQRIQFLLPRSEGLERKIPLDPAQLMQALRPCLHLDGLQAEDKIDLLNWFDKRVLEDLALLLDTANETLAAQGVLPELPRRQIIKGPATTSSKRKEPAKTTATLQDEDVHRLQSMLQLLPGSITPIEFQGRVFGASVSAVPLAPAEIPAGAEQTTLSSRDVLAMLSRLQQETSTEALAADASSPSVGDVRSALRAQMRQDEEEVQTVKRADEEVINLVSMIFDFILDDEELPTPMKALIGRLQIPMLKVAMLDASFFAPEEHPARSLLNLLARAGMGWSDVGEQGNQLYQRIEQVVFRIIHEFHDDVSLFDELLQDFKAYYTQQQKRQDLVEQRTREAEEGRARSDMARAMVQQTLGRRLRGRRLPGVVIEVLQEGWAQVLYLACLRHGVDSEAWKQATKVMDALIWLAQPGDLAWREKAMSLQGRILASVDKGLQNVALEARRLQDWKQALERDIALQSQGGQVATELVALSEESEPQAAQSQEPEDAITVLVEGLPLGAWVERLDRDPVDRCKLVARIRLLDKLVFTNQRGIKEIEVTGVELARRVRQGQWRLLDRQGRIFDRALETVVGALRQRQTRAA